MSVKFNYTFDTCDWPSSCADDREKCEEAFSEWFDNLSEKTKLAIYYAQCLAKEESDIGIDTLNQCPWYLMLYHAEVRIKERYAPYSLYGGHNLFLSIESIDVQEGETEGEQ